MIQTEATPNPDSIKFLSEKLLIISSLNLRQTLSIDVLLFLYSENKDDFTFDNY